MSRPRVHLSVVSHAQAPLAEALLRDVQAHVRSVDIFATLTLNVPEPLAFTEQGFSYPLQILRNPRPLGFAANHNQAYREGARRFVFDYHCVVNPDVRLVDDPFGPLIEALARSPRAALVAPLVRNSRGALEDNARRLPTPADILLKAARRRDRPWKAAPGQGVICPDWVAGMFMLFPKAVFEDLAGFDEKFFLYYEDVDLCCRARLQGYRILLDTEHYVIHDAQRASHRDFRHLRWHVASMLRFFTSRTYFRCRRLNRRINVPGAVDAGGECS